MEELKILIEMVADLPNAALWVIAALFAYKVCVVGSIYGVIRLAIVKTHDWLVTPKHKLIKTDVEATLRGMTISGGHDALIAQISRLRGKRTGIESEYIHARSVDWLREAIDEKEARESTPAGKAAHA